MGRVGTVYSLERCLDFLLSGQGGGVYSLERCLDFLLSGQGGMVDDEVRDEYTQRQYIVHHPQYVSQYLSCRRVAGVIWLHAVNTNKISLAIGTNAVIVGLFLS